VRVARVIVDVRARSLDRVFDYAIPGELADDVSIGVPVVVPFGSHLDKLALRVKKPAFLFHKRKQEFKQVCTAAGE
jgi:primosomal protein N'